MLTNFYGIRYLQYGFDLVFVKNAHAFVEEYLKKPEFAELMRRLGALGDGNQDQSTLSKEEWEVAYLYLAFVLRKRGGPNENQTTRKKGNNGQMQISKSDITYLNVDAN
ncbi:mRNA cap guanine-N7 methyltransferase [Thalictrum thalictroides]|uniref:mRNA (guanine-N(7))-methyltransferase n=1 Tax=Thalictrum thalictroides TaxID=46969 RepID=A0A7J6X952_THATH|nr:mRNA cap guanine-N7 methyltransferase [Thalictrum thalictroides]